MKFNVVEGDYVLIAPEIYESIKEDYINSDLTIGNIKKKYDLTGNKWLQIRKKIKDETGFVRSKYSRGKIPRNYYYSEYHDKFIVSKWVNKVLTLFAYADTEDEAKKIVEFLRDNDWDKEKLKIWRAKTKNKT